MPRSQPQITEIARYFAARWPAEGVEEEEGVTAWRETLRHARSRGVIAQFVRRLARADQTDPVLQHNCAEAARGV